MLGIATVLDASTALRHYRVSYRAPFRCNHDLCPSQLRVQETAAMSSDMGEFTLHVTVALYALACGVPNLRVITRRCDNCVYVAYMPFRISLALLPQAVAGCDLQRTNFPATVIKHPELRKMRLLVFSTGVVIFVGAKETSQMLRAFRMFTERFYQARQREPERPLVAADTRARRRAAASRKRARPSGPASTTTAGKPAYARDHTRRLLSEQ